jgi:hypothetical protein
MNQRRGILKFISGILLTCSFALSGISNTHAASDGFGRLFTTPEERKKLQELRHAVPEPEVEEVIEIIVDEIDEVAEIDEVVEEKAEPRDIEGITLNGIVYRKGNRSTVWLNGSNSYEGSLASEYFRINTSDISGEKVSVTVPEVNLGFDLKVGQTYEPNDESLLDIVEDGDGIIILKD